MRAIIIEGDVHFLRGRCELHDPLRDPSDLFGGVIVIERSATLCR